MNTKRTFRKPLQLILLALMATGLSASRTLAQAYPNTITFENQSGEGALVKLIGPVRWNIPVPNGTSRAINVPAGNYYILTRYCDSSNHCSYSKGDPFTVIQTETQYSDITITLHKVPNGNYRTYPATATEFNSN